MYKNLKIESSHLSTCKIPLSDDGIENQTNYPEESVEHAKLANISTALLPSKWIWVIKSPNLLLKEEILKLRVVISNNMMIDSARWESSSIHQFQAIFS